MTPVRQSRTRPITRRRSLGLSLMELMVGMTIGLVVSTAAVGTLVFMQSSSRASGESARLQQDATLVFNLMGQYLRSSGSVGLSQSPDGGIGFTSRSVFDGIPGSGGAVVRGDLQGNREVLQSAISTLSNAGINGPQIDCLGNTVPTGVSTVLTEFDWNSADGSLRCRRAPVTGDPSGVMTPQPIVGQVAQFVVHYGVRQADGSLHYRLRPAVPATDWALVHSVRVCLVLTSQGPVDEFHAIYRDTPGLAFDDCDPTDALVIDRNTLSNDPQRRMYRLYRQVFAVRSAAP